MPRRLIGILVALRINQLWGPPTLLLNGYLGLLPRWVQRPGREADHSPPPSVEVKNAWCYTSTHSIRGAELITGKTLP